MRERERERERETEFVSVCVCVVVSLIPSLLPVNPPTSIESPLSKVLASSHDIVVTNKCAIFGS